MFRKLTATLTIIFLCIFVHLTHAQDVPDLAEKALAATVSLEMTDAKDKSFYGSGFFISPTTIVTNFHVIASAAKGTAKLVDSPTPSSYRIQSVIATDPENDLALLKVTKVSGIHPLQLGDSSKMRIGEDIYVTGNPIRQTGTFSKGIISRIDKQTDRLQITAPVSPGSSGGPVLNSKGDVIGVVYQTIKGGQNLNLAIPAKYVKTLLKKNLPSTPSFPPVDDIDAQTFVQRGWSLYLDDFYMDAAFNFSRAIIRNPNYVDAYIGRGYAYSAFGHPEAISDFNTAIVKDPDNASAYIGRGIVKNELGKSIEAISDFNTAIAKDPDNTVGYLGRASANFKLGKSIKAISDLDTVIAKDPDDAEAYEYRGIVKSELGKYSEAKQDMETALKLAIKRNDIATQKRVEESLLDLHQKLK